MLFKSILSTTFFCVLLSCQNNKSIKTDFQNSDSIKKAFYVKSDTIVIAVKNDTISYSKEKFNEIVDYFPIFYEPIPQHPDIAYYASGIFKKFKDKKGNEKTISFGSEVGQDEFYELYAYFLMKQNNFQELKGKRDTLFKIYQCINSIFGLLRHGGTFFGHQARRINGYVEYDLWIYSRSKEYFNNSYDITKQKSLYLIALKQIIKDEVSVDYDRSPDFSKNQIAAINENLTKLDSLLSDYFYLVKARQFHYSNY